MINFNNINISVVLSAPDVPKLGYIDHGESSMNVSWSPSDGDPVNPGSDFVVKIRREGMS